MLQETGNSNSGGRRRNRMSRRGQTKSILLQKYHSGHTLEGAIRRDHVLHLKTKEAT